MKLCQCFLPSCSLWDFWPPPFFFYNNYFVQQFTDGWTAWIADDGKAS